MNIQTLLDVIRPYALNTLAKSGTLARYGAGVLGGFPGMVASFGPSAMHRAYNAANNSIQAATAAGLNPVNVGAAMGGAVPPMMNEPNASPFDQAFAAANQNQQQNAGMTDPLTALASKLRVTPGISPVAPTNMPSGAPNGVPLPPPRPLNLGPVARVPETQTPQMATSAPDAPQSQQQPPYGFVDSPGYMGEGSTRGDFLGSLFGSPGAGASANNTALVQQLLKLFV